MPDISIKKVLKALAINPWTAVIVRRDLAVVALEAQQGPSTPEFIIDLNNRYVGMVFKLVPKGEYGKDHIDRLMDDIRQAFELRDEGVLPPGTTCL